MCYSVDTFEDPGGTPLHEPYTGTVHGVLKGFVLAPRFGLKTGMDFAHFGLESGCGLKGNYGSV